MNSGHPAEASTRSSYATVEGKRYASVIKLKPEYRERYIVLHAHPFPGLIEQLRASGLRNYSIFLKEDLLFSLVEYTGDEYSSDMTDIENNSTVQDWWKLTDPMQETLSTGNSNEWWVSMKELFHCGTKVKPSHKSARKAFVYHCTNGSEEDIYSIYADTLDSSSALIEEASIQNFCVYYWNRYIFKYFEYTGDNYDEDIAKMKSDPIFLDLSDSLSYVMSGNVLESEMLREAKQVFYMK